jgi:hypothetical protein
VEDALVAVWKGVLLAMVNESAAVVGNKLQLTASVEWRHDVPSAEFSVRQAEFSVRQAEFSVRQAEFSLRPAEFRHSWMKIFPEIALIHYKINSNYRTFQRGPQRLR